jgi:uroporphyrinogen III methyltransferase/synthase
MAAQVTIVTGHEDPAKSGTDLDWAHLARTPGTLVFLMGVSSLEANMARLVEEGMAPDTPAAVVASGTRPAQRTVSGTVGTIAAAAAGAAIRPPAITLVGQVASLHERLAWFERRPLFGRRVVVTRARAQASGLAARLAELGAEVLQAPAITIEELPFRPPDLAGYDIVCLTSANGVERLLARDVRALAGVTVAAVGSATAAALRRRGIEPDVLPEQAVQESLLDALGEVAGKRVLIATAEGARDVLAAGLRDRGAEVDEIALYRTVREPVDAELVLSADLITFTSSSTVTNVLDALDGHDLSGLRAVSIGPVTSGTLRERGVEPVAEADPHDVDGLVAAVLAVAAG